MTDVGDAIIIGAALVTFGLIFSRWLHEHMVQMNDRLGELKDMLEDARRESAGLPPLLRPPKDP